MICRCWTSPRGAACPESLRRPTESIRSLCRCTIQPQVRVVWLASWLRRSRSASPSELVSSSICQEASSTQALTPLRRKWKSVWSAWLILSTAILYDSCPAFTSTMWIALTRGSCAPSPVPPAWSRSMLPCCPLTKPTEHPPYGCSCLNTTAPFKPKLSQLFKPVAKVIGIMHMFGGWWKMLKTVPLSTLLWSDVRLFWNSMPFAVGQCAKST